MQSPLPNSADAQVLARAVSAQFASRPTLRAVITRLIEQQIIEKTAPLNTDTASIHVALPNASGGYDLELLINVALGYLASGDAPDFTRTVEGRKPHLVDAARRRVTFARIGDSVASTWPGIAMIETVIRELPGIVHIGFQEDLATYWNAPGISGISRWQWLGSQLANAMRSAAIRATDPTIRDTLTQVVDHPDRQGLAPATGIQVFALETRLSKGTLSAKVLSAELLITRAHQVLRWGLSGFIDSYPSMDDFLQAWQVEMSLEFDVDTLRLKRYEPEGNLFDVQAALLFNQQLEDLAALILPAGLSVTALEQLLSRVTDPVPSLSGAPGADAKVLHLVQSALPQWLSAAPPGAQLAYRKHSLELASVRQASQGKSWSDGIDSVRVFAAKQLHRQMLLDQPQAPGYQPDQLELTFHVPVGDQGSGYIEQQKMTLTELALKNLSGKPKGRMTVRHTGDQLIQDWTTPEYLLDLVTRVDIGKAWPQLLKDLLLTDTAPSRERSRLYGNELKVMLPLSALELAIKGEQGFTSMGYQFIAALVQPDRVNRIVEKDEIVIRPLAFRRKPDAEPDVVDNMFVIERANNGEGPHLLYRPLYEQSLHQFPDRAALLATIAAPGAIQESVLAWLPDRTRPIYQHGGFKEPHIVHFSPLDPFGLPDRPAPASLAGESYGSELTQSLRNGQLMHYLFGSNARALVDLADRDTVSNAESRWTIVLEGGWLLFNTLLALPLSPPVMLVGWMVSLASSLAQDIPALGSQDATAREQGLVDLLLNIALVLLHGVQNIDPPASAPGPEEQSRSGLALDPLRRQNNDPVTALPPADQGPVALPSEPPGSGETPLDFDKSLAREASAARLLDRLMELRVEWPKVPVPPIEIGPFKGILRIADLWYASVGGLLFQVSIVPGFGEVFIIHPQKPDHPGIKLKTDGKGHWSLDRGLKLVGGGPKKRIAAFRAELASRVAPMLIDKTRIRERLDPLITAQNQAITKARQTRAEFELQRTELVKAWEKLKATTPAPAETVEEHQAWQDKTRNARVACEVAMRVLLRRLDETLPVRRELIEVLKQIRGLENTAIYEQEHLHELNNMTRTQMSLSLLLRDQGRDVGITAQGEDLNALVSRASEEIRQGGTALYQQLFEVEKLNAERGDALIECSSRIESLLDEMAQVSPAGAALRNDILRGIERPEVFYASNLKLQSLQTYRELALDRSGRFDDPTELYFMTRLVGEGLRSAYTAHVEMRSRNGYSVGDRISIYEDVIGLYVSQEQATRSLQDLGSSHLRALYKDTFVQRLVESRLLAEQDLAAAILESEEGKIPPPSTTPLKKKTDGKRVFKSRNKGTLVGEVRQQRSPAGEELIDIVDVQTGAVVTTFHKHSLEGVYVELVDAPPPARPTAQRSATAAIAAGNKLMLERSRREAMIEREVRQMNDPLLREEKTPQDWHTLLEQIADQLDAIVSELESVQTVTATTTQAIDTFRTEAADLRNSGRRYRNHGYKRQAPTADKVFTLWRDKEVDIQPIKTRELTQAKDFLSEFAIRDKASNEVLWYAHFHYTNKNDGDLAYVAGHLKRREQRTLGLKAQFQQAADAREVARIWRGKVSTEMARKLFFYNA